MVLSGRVMNICNLLTIKCIKQRIFSLGEAQQYAKTHKNKTFILKPDQGAQGKGISITKTLKDIKPTDRMICQVYLSKV